MRSASTRRSRPCAGPLQGEREDSARCATSFRHSLPVIVIQAVVRFIIQAARLGPGPTAPLLPVLLLGVTAHTVGTARSDIVFHLVTHVTENIHQTVYS